MAVLLVFIDGIGIGDEDPDKNPFARYRSPFLSHFKNPKSAPEIASGGILVATDVTMGIPGLPQSATGQTALFTGVNAARVLGRHLSGFPTPSLREVIKKDSIFLKVERMGKVATFANAFTDRYFKRPERAISSSTWTVRASGFPFRTLEEHLVNDQAISHDLTNKFLSRLGYEAPIRTPEAAAAILADIVESVDFCMFEYFLTDLIGHAQDMEWAGTELDKLNAFLQVLLEKLDAEEHLVILTSDHGNFEDLSVNTHTLNLVPTIIWGRQNKQFADKLEPRIERIAPCMLQYLESN